MGGARGAAGRVPTREPLCRIHCMGKSTRIFCRYLFYGTSQWALGLSSWVGFASAVKLFPQGRRRVWNAQALKLLNVTFLSWMEECAHINLVESSSAESVQRVGICLQASPKALNPARGSCAHTAFGNLLSAWGCVSCMGCSMLMLAIQPTAESWMCSVRVLAPLGSAWGCLGSVPRILHFAAVEFAVGKKKLWESHHLALLETSAIYQKHGPRAVQHCI